MAARAGGEAGNGLSRRVNFKGFSVGASLPRDLLIVDVLKSPGLCRPGTAGMNTRHSQFIDAVRASAYVFAITFLIAIDCIFQGISPPKSWRPASWSRRSAAFKAAHP